MHIHKWEKWTDISLQVERLVFNGERQVLLNRTMSAQERHCLKCGKLQRRRVLA